MQDGPDQIDEVTVREQGKSGTQHDLKSPAKEHNKRGELDDPATLGGSKTYNVRFTFGSALDIGGDNEFAMVRITLYFANGHTETYSVHLYT
jgi:hypothetical protein